jgi:hypothetical protein
LVLEFAVLDDVFCGLLRAFSGHSIRFRTQFGEIRIVGISSRATRFTS